MSLLFFAALAVRPSAVVHSWTRVGGAGYHVVRVDPSRARLTTLYRPGGARPWAFVRGREPAAMLTGTFFAPVNGVPVADVLVDGRLAARGNRGSALGIRRDGRVDLWDRPFRRSADWSDYRWGLRGGVRILSAGKVRPNPRAQAFRDPRIWGRAERVAVGKTRSGKLVMIATKSRVTLSELGRAARAMGATDALAFDGGGSACLYVGGRMVVPTARRLSNVLMVLPAG